MTPKWVLVLFSILMMAATMLFFMWLEGCSVHAQAAPDILSSPLDPSKIPDRCKGAEIRCSESITSCTLMHCPTTIVYDDTGKALRTEATCKNRCTFTKVCSCDGYAFTYTEE